MLDRTRLLLSSAVLLLSLAASVAAQFQPVLNINCTRGDSLA
jgi:hypothetical protein